MRSGPTKFPGRTQDVSGNESLKREGQAQQDKAAAQRDVAVKEAEAEKARAQASAAEAEQRSHQRNP